MAAPHAQSAADPDRGADASLSSRDHKPSGRLPLLALGVGSFAIGTGGNYALAAARALAETDMDAEAIVRRSLAIAAEICVYTNANVVIETLDAV